VAITAIDYSLFRAMRAAGQLPQGGDVLELGEANWYGDVGLADLIEDIHRYVPEGERAALLQRLDELVETKPRSRLFDLAKIFWTVFLQPKSLTSIDFHGTERALMLDLNKQLELPQSYDLILNFGTLEHIFNVPQALKTVHDHIRPGGMMIHGMPFSGFVDHGFYSFHPTFYWDLAHANGYAVEAALYTQLDPLKLIRLEDRETVSKMSVAKAIGENSLIYVVLRSPAERKPFRIPLQGYYAGTLTPDAQARWGSDR
jgi:SAM-dependent methyltransferase